MTTFSNPSHIRRELLEKFGDDTDAKIIEESVKLCQMYNIGGEDLFFKWEAMRFGSGPGQFTLDSVEAIKAQIQRDLAKANLRKQQARANLMGPLSRGFGAGLGRPGGRFDASSAMKTPTKPAIRTQDGFGLALGGERKMPVAGPSKVNYVGPNTDEAYRKQRAYHYMYEKVSERSEAIDDRIDEFGELVKEHYKVDELGDPTTATEEDMTVVGRITLDAESSAGSVKLNEASLTLESSRIMGAGARVPLRFDPNVKILQGKQGVSGIGLFPGAIVALRGKNGGGGSFIATEILSLPQIGPSSQSRIKLESGDSSFSMCIACGPFTPDADLKYKPWNNLIVQLKAKKPTVILLLGPFVDSAHSLVKNGDIDISPAEIFQQEFLAPLRDFLDSSPGSIALIVPSLRDVISTHAVFPQCELGAEFNVDPRIHLLPNPARFSLNDISFGVSSIDVLFHLRKEEFFKRAQEWRLDGEFVSASVATKKVGTLFSPSYIRNDGRVSFYPIFPVPLELSHEVNLDVTHWDGLKLCNDLADGAPDVLISPSRLKQFSKVVDTTITVNPSFLTKGTYAMLHYAGHSNDSLLKDRLKADVLRLE
ncbi:DNA polymerase alpha subunit B [Grifola frondosa]|uniref:DNA polymerase alpha subunit B n=1 Tax=Grifola frondosa TaxID=5627 RepID=A0A1C7LWQ8_GRIFR|nr:DNA polymerase alpha subunit B [Grifola frondosa]